MKKIYPIVLLLSFLPNFSFGYLNEYTSTKVKSKRISHYKQVDITETADTDGVIRKVAWSGPHHPDLENLLGPCYEAYQNYLKKDRRMRMRGVVSIEQNGCHINLGGHMRSMHGQVSIDK